jgi:hypothetical protein
MTEEKQERVRNEMENGMEIPLPMKFYISPRDVMSMMHNRDMQDPDVVWMGQER